MTGGPRAYRSRWTLASVAAFFYWLAVQSLRPFVTLHLADLGASEAEVGLVVAAQSFLSLFLAVPAGRMVDRRGLRRYMLLSLLTMGLVGVGYALTNTIIQVAVMQLLAGVTELGAWIGIQALITRSGEGSFRHRHLALFSIMWGTAFAVGPSVGAWVFDMSGFEAVGVLYALCAAGAALLLVAVPYRDRPLAPDGHSAGGRGRPRRTGTLRELKALGQTPAILAVLIGSFVALWANSLRTSFYPLFLENEGIPIPVIGILMSIAGATMLVGRIPLAWLVRKYGARRVLTAATVTAVISLASTPLLLTSPILLAVGSALFGVGFGLNTPITIELMAEHSDDTRRGLAMGLRVASNRAAQLLQPLLFGVVAAALGMGAGFGAGGLLMGLGVGLMMRWLGPWGAGTKAQSPPTNGDVPPPDDRMTR